MTTVSTVTAPAGAGARARWVPLPIILTGLFVTILDFFIVNVAVPSMRAELGATPAGVELVVAGYGLAYAAGLITGGRLGDLFGRRRLFAIGLAAFTLASLACGVAPGIGMLTAARVVQGLSAALLAPQVLTLLGAIYTGRDRGRAFTAYGLTAGLAGVGGQVIGGALIQADVAGWGWRTCFLVNLPIGVVALALTRFVPESRPDGARRRLDLPGAVLASLGMPAIVVPLAEGRDHGWPAWSWACLAASVPLLLAFAVRQRRLRDRGGAPLVDPALFRHRAFTAGAVTVLVYQAGVASFFLVLALYLQAGRGMGALAAGTVFGVLGVAYLAASLCGQRVAAWLGRQSLALGAVVRAAGLTLLGLAVARYGVHGPIAALVPGLALDGVGQGLVLAPLTGTVLARLDPAHAGAASGVLTTVMQAGNALGVAAVGVVFFGTLGASPAPAAYGPALDAAVVLLVVLALAVAACVQLLPRGAAR